MFILIEDTNKISKFILDSDIEYKGISIYSKNSEYYINLKNGFYFSDKSKCKKLEIKSYDIQMQSACYEIHLYVYENDMGIHDYGLYENSNFVIACEQKANIRCLDPYLQNSYLAYKNGCLYSNRNIVVNEKKYDEQILQDGDVIEYLGIKIIYYNEFLYINKFNIDVKIKEYKNSNSIVKYGNNEQVTSYYIPETVCELVIDKLKEYKQIKRNSNFDFIKSLLPNVVMCIAMAVMASLNYINSTSNTNILSYIVIPISMFLSSLIIPVVFLVIGNYRYYKDNKKNINDYYNYLIEYEDNLKSHINKYINSLNSHYFDLFDSKKMVFYGSSNSDDFMKLSIGKRTLIKQIEFNKTSVDKLDEKICEIENIANNIDDYPVFVDLKKHKIVTIVTSNIDANYYFNKYLLELAYKHHYDDINIGIYSTNHRLFDNVYNLPHLFFHKQRLTLDSYEQLQALDQSKLNKPLILFMLDRCDYVFQNEKIYQIYFSKDINDIRKNSSIIIEHNNNTGCLYDEDKTIFNYLMQDIDFKSYFAYIGRFKSISNQNSIFDFKNIFTDELYVKQDKHSLQATFAYDNNKLVSLDLHESKQGPHGLIGGSTGSGKSELIISMLLSLCIRYNPEYLNIVLIDYKGGGIGDSLSYKGINIPHIIASICNLENNVLDRLIIGLRNECNKRQLLFKQLSNLTHTSIMNLDDYIDNYLEYGFENIAHLLIVVDEFAELKKENPEQIKELISISRIGRSLGLHLILATQKPAGVIDEQIWSNSRFKLALKTFEEKDSYDIIKSNDAAFLSNPGSFLMRIDNNLFKGQSIYAKNDYYGNDPYKVSILNNSLSVDKTYKSQTSETQSVASYYSYKIIETSLKNRYMVKPLEYLPPYPMNRDDINEKGSFVFGQIDDYINNNKQILKYDILDNLLIYSSRSDEINSILNTLNDNNRNTIVIGNKCYQGSSISDSVLYDDSEDIEYLFKYLLNNQICNLTLVIEDIACLLSYNDAYIQVILKLIKRSKNNNYNLVFITSSAELNFKLINAFSNRIMINVLENNDLSSFYGSKSRYKGDSYFFDNELIPFIPINEEYYISGICNLEKIIKRIPDSIEADIKNNKYLLGFDCDNKCPIYHDNNIVLVSYDKSILSKYKNAYKDIEILLYDSSIKIDLNKPILWLGSGSYNQRLFVCNRKDDILSNQGILIENNEKKLIRSINNE